MVQIKLSQALAFILAAATLAPVVALPAGSKGGSGSAVKKTLPKIPAKRPDRPDPKPKPTPKSPSKPTPKSPSQDPDDIRIQNDRHEANEAMKRHGYGLGLKTPKGPAELEYGSGRTS